MGRLTKKISRHDSPAMFQAMSTPPSSGPRMVARPMTTPNIPKTLPRSAGLKVTWMTERTWGYMSPENMP